MNKTLHLSVINDGASYEQRKRLARNHFAGTADHYRELRDDVIKPAAEKERQAFGNKCSAADLRAATLAVMAYDRAHCLELMRDAYDEKKQIFARGRKWFDSANGNTYHSVSMTVAGYGVYIPMAYGYDDQWKQTAYDWLVTNGILDALPKYENGNQPRDYSAIEWGAAPYGLKREL